MTDLKEKIATLAVTLFIAALFTAIAIVSCEKVIRPDATEKSPPDSMRWQEFKKLGAGTYRDTTVIGMDTIYSTITQYSWGLVEEYKSHDYETVTITKYPKNDER